MGKFSNMLHEDSISRIRGPCDGDEGWGAKYCDRKNQTDVFDFLAAIFITQFPPLHIAISGPSNSQYCFHQTFLRIFKNVWQRYNIENLRVLRLWGGGVGNENRGRKNQNIRRNVEKKHFSARSATDRPAKHEAQGSIPVSCFWSPSRLQSRPTFLWDLPAFSQTGRGSQSASFDMAKPLGLSSTCGCLSRSTRLLGQAAPPIWSDAF